MKIFCFCHKCLSDNQLENPLITTLREDNLYDITCQFGHRNLMQMQAFKFEILFESGLCAIREQYYLESMLSIKAALERFYEFYIQIMLKEKGIDESVITDVFKEVSRNSEREYGAFLFVYTLMHGKKPETLLSRSQVEFRNGVVHKGLIPTEKQVFQFASDVFDIIKRYYVELLKNNRDHIDQFSLKLLSDNAKKHSPLKIPISTMSSCMCLDRAIGADCLERKTLEDHYKNVVMKYFNP